jgi:hypothetical protein
MILATSPPVGGRVKNIPTSNFSLLTSTFQLLSHPRKAIRKPVTKMFTRPRGSRNFHPRDIS